MLRFVPLLVAAFVLAACTPSDTTTEAPITVRWTLVDNASGEGQSFASELTLVNDGAQPLPAEGWALYFNFLRRPDPQSFPPEVQLTRFDGDFYRIAPTDQFDGLAPGDSLTIPFRSSYYSLKITDVPRGFYFVFEDENGEERPPMLPAAVTIGGFDDLEQITRGPADQVPVPTSASYYAENASLTLLPEDEIGRIVPTPVRTTPSEGSFALNADVAISAPAALSGEAAYLADALEPLLGARLAIADEAGGITLRVGEVDGAEAYRLVVTPDGVEIVGGGPAGVFYGIQSLRALLPVDAYAEVQEALDVPAVTVEDAPRFRYRGLHLDVARNFFDAATVTRMFDLMSFYKLNRFHFHLTDDEGWRLPVAALPELTEVGGRRGHTLDESEHLQPALGSGPYPDRPTGSGSYTRAAFVELLRAASTRHIHVIPEIDVPGHARAAIRAMEVRYERLAAEGREDEAAAHRLIHPDDTSSYRSVQNWPDNVIDVCQESTYRFLEVVFDELQALYAEAGAPLSLVHVGGDEVPRGVWTGSPVCAALIAENDAVASVEDLPAYFIGRVVDLLEERGLRAAGWEEVALEEEEHDGRTQQLPKPELTDRDVVPYVWTSVWGWNTEDLAYKLANAGYDVVMANASPFYLDFAYDKHPEEPGYYWGGIVATRDPFDFIPLDLFKGAEADLLGRSLSEANYTDATRLTEAGKEHVLGLQGALWSETFESVERLDFMTFPRLLTLAERAWAPQPAWAVIADRTEREEARDEAWNEFANRLGGRELARLDRLNGGVLYRIPPPGAVLQGGQLYANVALPGLVIRYTTDGTEPDASSPRYTEPVRVDGEVLLRTFASDGRSSRTVRADPAEGP